MIEDTPTDIQQRRKGSFAFEQLTHFRSSAFRQVLSLRLGLVAGTQASPHIHFSMESFALEHRDSLLSGADLGSQQQPCSFRTSPDLQTSPETRIALLKKLQREKATRQLKLRRLEDKRKQQLAAEDDEMRRIALAEQAKRREETLAKLAEQRMKLQRRQIDRKLVKAQTEEALAQVQRRSYLYQQLDEQSKAQAVAMIRTQEEALKQRRMSLQGAANFSSISLLRHDREIGSRSVEREESRREKCKSQERRFRLWRAELRAIAPNKQEQRWAEEVRTSKQEVLRRAKSAQTLYERKQRYAELVRELYPPLRRQLPAPASPSPPRKVPVAYPVLRRQKKRWTPQPVRHSAAITPPPERKDYLTPLRLQRETTFRSRSRLPCPLQLASILSNSRLAPSERVRQMQREVQRADSAAKAQECMLNRMERGWSLGTEGRQAAADLYIASIRAKLSLLGQL